MTYLVTGGAGFIGSHLVRGLLAAGGAVRVLDDFSTGMRGNLADQKGQLEILEGDVRDTDILRQAMRDVEVVFHEAAFVSVAQSMEEPADCLDVNVNGTARLLSAARTAGIRRVVLASSAAVYGDAAPPHLESTQAAPLSAYGLSKQVGEMYAQLFDSTYGLEVTALRYFNVYGSRQRDDSMYAGAIPIFVRQLQTGGTIRIFGDGHQTRDLVHVSDVVRANLAAAEHPRAHGQIFNVCTGTETTILDVLEALFEFFPEHTEPEFGPARAGEIYRSVGDPSKAATTISFRAQVRLREGLEEVVRVTRATGRRAG